MLLGRARISVDKVVSTEDNLVADIKVLTPAPMEVTVDVRARFQEMINKVQTMNSSHPSSTFSRNIISLLHSRQEQDMYLTCDMAASACTTSVGEQQV